MNASVAWDVNGCAYNQNSAEAQKFSVNGTVTLPDGVTNPDNLNLIVSVNVSVSRGPIVSPRTQLQESALMVLTPQRPRSPSQQLEQEPTLRTRLRVM